jgi:hypothetical protein
LAAQPTPPGRVSLSRQRGQLNALGVTALLGRNEADLPGFVNHGRLPPLEREIEKLLSRNGIGSAVGLKFVMDCRFET